MRCSDCGLEMAVAYGYNQVTGDASDKEQTKLYRVIVYKCMNKNCKGYLNTKEERIAEIVGPPTKAPEFIPKE